MNFKDFKKVKEDEKSAVFKNKNGHEIRVAKNALEKSHLEALKKLPLHAADGTVAQNYESEDEPAPEWMDPNLPNASTETIEPQKPAGMSDYAWEAQQKASSPYEKDYQENADAKAKEDAQLAAYQARTHSDAPVYPSSFKNGKEQDWVSSDSDMQPSQQPQGIFAQAQGRNPNDFETLSNDNSDSQATGQPTAADVQQSQQQSKPQAQPQQPQSEGQVYQDTYNKTMNDSQAQRAQEDAAWAQDLQNGHVTPPTYASLFAKQDTLGKIGTLFGLLISGAGSGLAHQKNGVMAMMEDELNKDLQAQTQSKTNAQNYLKIAQQGALNKAAIEKTGAETEQYNLQNIKLDALNKMMGATVHHVNSLNQKLPENSQARQIGNQTVNELQQVTSQKMAQNNNIAAQQEAAFKANNARLRWLGQDNLAASNEQRHVPGIGDASIPVPENTRQEFIAHQKLTIRNKALWVWLKFAIWHKASLTAVCKIFATWRMFSIFRTKMTNLAAAS